MKKTLKNFLVKIFPYHLQEVVIVIGTGRTGTEFLAKIIADNYASQILSYHEPAPDLLNLSVEEKKNNLSEAEVINRIREYRIRYLMKAFFTRKVYFESNNNVSFLLPFITKAFPNIKLIYMIRNLDSFLVSEMNKRHGKDKFLIYSESDRRERISPALLNQEYNNWPSATRERKIIWYWTECNRVINGFLHKNAPESLIIKFEELFGQNGKSVLSAILKYIGVRNYESVDDAIFSQKHNSSKHKEFKGTNELNPESQELVDQNQRMINKLISQIN